MTIFHGCISIVTQIIRGVVSLLDSVMITPNVSLWTFSLALMLVTAFIGVFFVIAKR